MMAAEYVTECFVMACRHEDYDWARKKLLSGADPHARDSDGKTPLQYACEHGQLDFLKLLIEKYNCDVRQYYGEYRQTLVHIACKNGHADILQYLVRNQGCSPVDGDAFEWTPLHYACRYGHINIVKFLVGKQHCSPEVNDNQQRTPLYYAAMRGHTNIEEYLNNPRCCAPYAGHGRKKTHKHAKRYVTAAYDYTAQEDDELTFSIGQVIEVLEEITDDWWQGKVNGKKGMFPTNYVHGKQ